MTFQPLVAVSWLALTACQKSAPPVSAADARIAAGAAEDAVPNPFADAQLFVNPHYRDSVLGTLEQAPDDLHETIGLVADVSTAVWLDRIAAIQGGNGRLSLRDHLDEAARQQSGDEPVTIVFVVYDLPDRDCAAGASAGELRLSDGGLGRYMRDFIDPLASAFADPAYAGVRKVVILEPDSLPNLVTNLGLPSCRAAAPGYREGIAYAIRTLAAAPSTYVYLDIAHSGWLGWDNPGKAARVYREVMEQAGGEHLVQGFATNVSNYTPLHETFDPYTMPGAYGGLIGGFFENNPIIDEHSYVDVLREHFPDHGFVIDTGRNGWGGRIGQIPRDGRSNRRNWCNVQGAGLGERPRANPRRGVDAYYWIKPPGESDGAGSPGNASEGLPFDAMCAPSDERSTDATPNAPVAGAWFAEAFVDLVRNASPPIY